MNVTAKTFNKKSNMSVKHVKNSKTGSVTLISELEAKP